MNFRSPSSRARRLPLSLAVAVLLAGSAVHAASAATPDGDLFASYSLGPSATSVHWIVCGSTTQTQGCYGAGTLGSFGQVAAMMEGARKIKGNVVTREIYVCDVASGDGTGVTLYDYTRTDVVSATDDAVGFTLKKAVPLNLVGGAGAACQMTANSADVYVSVNQGLASVTKAGLVASGGPSSISSITANHLGNMIFDYTNGTFTGMGISGGGEYFAVSSGAGTDLTNVPLYSGGFAAPSSRKRAGAAAVGTQAALDANLYTNYSRWSSASLGFLVCGSTQQSEGCYGSGSLGPFGHAGAMVESLRSTSGDTVTRHIFVCDDAAGTGGTGVSLYVYKRTDVISSSYDSTTMKLVRTIPLPLVGGANAQCAISVSNSGGIFVGTRNGNIAVKVAPSNFAVTTLSAPNPALPFATVTADTYGFVAAAFGSGASSGVVEYAPDGTYVQSMGGASFVLNTWQAVQTSRLPTTTAAVVASALKVTLKHATR